MSAETCDERREVAERLRGLDVEITSHDTLEKAVDKLMKAVCGERPFSPVRYSVRNLCGIGYVLADLIDPTCRMTSLGSFTSPHDFTRWECDKCGADTFTPYKWDVPRFCSNCGARLVSDDD